jgi:AcrR family transcriptional regulator
MPRTEEANQHIREERRIQICEVALKVFARKGLTDTRIADIAAEAGMSQGLIYRYFASKEELFKEVFDKTTALMLELCRQAQAQPLTPLEKIGWLTTQLLPLLYLRPEGAQIIMHALINEGVPDGIRQTALEYTVKVQEPIRQLIEEGQAAGQIIACEPARLAILYLSTLQGLSASAGYLPGLVSDFPDVDMILLFLRPKK